MGFRTRDSADTWGGAGFRTGSQAQWPARIFSQSGSSPSEAGGDAATSASGQGAPSRTHSTRSATSRSLSLPPGGI